MAGIPSFKRFHLRRPRWTPALGRRLRRMGITLLVSALAIFTWNAYLNVPPHETYPLPPLPSENAYDYFLQAAPLMHDVPNLDLPVTSPPFTFTMPDDSKHTPITDEALAVMLEKNADALRIIHTGVQYPYQYPWDISKDYYTEENRAGKSRMIRNHCNALLAAEMLIDAKRAMWNEAAQAADYLLCGSLNSAVPTEYYTPALKQLQRAFPKLSLAEKRRAVASFAQTVECFHPLADKLEQSRAFALYEAKSDFQIPDNARYLPNSFRWSGDPRITPSALETRSIFVNLFYAWTIPNRTILRTRDQYLRRCIAVARQPICAHVPFPKAPPDIYNYQRFGYSEWEISHLSDVMQEFTLQSQLLSLALDGYGQQHQSYPESLQQLIDDHWLSRIPADPFTQADSLCYRRQGGAYLLYSRGPDGEDDGGHRITTGSRYTVLLKSRGDVVFGVNTTSQSHTGYL